MSVDENQQEEVKEYLERYRVQTKGKHILHMQFYSLAKVIMEWKNGGNVEKIQSDIIKAWNLTKSGKEIRILQGQYFSFFEIALVMLYVRLLDERGEVASAEEGYSELLFYLENRVSVQDRVKWYPQISYRQIRLLRKKGNVEKALKIGANTLDLLRNQASLNYLIEILEEYSKLLKDSYLLKEERMPPDVERQRKDMDFICASLCWLYKEYGIKRAEWIFKTLHHNVFGLDFKVRHRILHRIRQKLHQ